MQGNGSMNSSSRRSSSYFLSPLQTQHIQFMPSSTVTCILSSRKAQWITYSFKGREPTVSGFTSNNTLTFLKTSLHNLALLLYSFHITWPFFYIPYNSFFPLSLSMSTLPFHACLLPPLHLRDVLTLSLKWHLNNSKLSWTSLTF